MHKELKLVRHVKDLNRLALMEERLIKEGVYFETSTHEGQAWESKSFELKTRPELVDAVDFYLRDIK